MSGVGHLGRHLSLLEEGILMLKSCAPYPAECWQHAIEPVQVGPTSAEQA